MRILFIFFIILLPLLMSSQKGISSTDSIEILIKKTKNKNINVALTEQAALVLKCYQAGERKRAEQLYKDALQEAISTNSKIGLSALYSSKGMLFYYENKFDSSLFYFEACYDIRVEIKDTIGAIKALNNKASIFYTLADYKGALNVYDGVLKDEANAGYDEGTYVSINNLGYIYSALKMHKKAIEVFRKAEKTFSKTNNLQSLIYTYDGLSIAYSKIGNDSCMFYAFKTAEYSEKLNNKYLLSSSLLNIGELYTKKQEYMSAEKYLSQALKVSTEIGDKRIELGVYTNFLRIELAKNRLSKAFEYVEKIIELQRQLNIKAEIKDLSLLFSSYYYQKQDYQRAYGYLTEHNQYKDSMYNIQTARLSEEMLSKYQSAKKDSENEKLQAENETQKTRGQYLIIILVIALAGGVGAIIVNKKIGKANQLLALQKNAIEQKNSLLEIQKNEIIEQKGIVDEKQKEIIDSINYAKRIQSGLFANQDLIRKHVEDVFVLFKPKDIVSGDFYWATQFDTNFYLAVCDSTGHGVPGSFMSLLNIGFLSEAIKEKNIKEPNKVFNSVRERLIDVISKDGQKDGMDGVLICFEDDQHEQQRKMTYAAANIEPILIRNGELIELPKDKMPIGKGEIEASFSLQTVMLQEGDMLYVYTDGFADQFGGEKGKKFKYKQLNELLLSIATQPLHTQREALNKNFEDWKGHMEQIDDVCVVGIRI